MNRYTWRTDAAHGEIQATDKRHALALLIEQGEWASGEQEARDLLDGAWLTIFDDEGYAVLRRGVVP